MGDTQPASDPVNLVSSPETVPADPADLVINMEDVSVLREGNEILHGINWRVELDERWIIMGPNGAGKTTLMKLAAAQLFPTTGTVDIIGERVGSTALRDLRTAVGMASSSLAQRIPDGEKVADIVISAGYDVLGSWREEYDSMDFEQLHEILDVVGAAHIADRRWGTLSEGERKRALIARALMTDPELLLLDEPGAGLDLGGREDLIALLSDIAEDPYSPATVVVTHHVEEIPPGFTHGLLLDEGGVVAQGLLPHIMTSENLTKAYHQPIEVTEDAGRWFARRTRRAGHHRSKN